MTKIKICGITDKSETEYLNRNRVDYAGFVLFFPKSRRNITAAKASEIKSHLAPDIKTVAVTVSPNVDELREIEAAGFDFIQIHGTLTEEVLAAANISIIRAFNEIDTKAYEAYLSCDKITGYLFDAGEPGSGKTFNWDNLKGKTFGDKTVILAGGLNPQNVRQAIEYLHPDVVDVSSGVEYDFDAAGESGHDGNAAGESSHSGNAAGNSNHDFNASGDSSHDGNAAGDSGHDGSVVVNSGIVHGAGPAGKDPDKIDAFVAAVRAVG